MKILKSTFKFQPSDDLFQTDKFKQIVEFIKVTANLKRKFVMVVTPDILTALAFVTPVEPIGPMMWQTSIERNRFEIIPDIFHPMNKPGYILIRYVEADTVTLIEFEEHMMGTFGESGAEFSERYEKERSQVSEDVLKETDEALSEEEQVKDPRELRLAERVGDKYVFDPEICRPSTETCGQCIHGVCCDKARRAKSADRMRSEALNHIKSKKSVTNTDFELKSCVDPNDLSIMDMIKRILDDAGIKYKIRTNILQCKMGDRAYMIDVEENNGGKNLVAIYRIGDDPSDQEILFFDSDMTSEKYNELTSYIQKLIAENTEQSDENDEIPLWKTPIERIEKVLHNYGIEYTREDAGECHYIRYETNYHVYTVYFEESEPTECYHAVLSVKDIGEGKVLWSGLISSHNMLRDLERAVVERIKPMEKEEC